LLTSENADVNTTIRRTTRSTADERRDGYKGGATMASVAVIPELETELSQARDAAEALLAQFAAMIEAERFSIYSILPPDVLARAREISARFHVPLVRVLALARQSQMLGSTDVDAIRLAAKRIEAALRLREYEEWGPQILNDEDRVLGVRPAGFSEDRWLPPDRALMEIDDALDQVLRRLGVLSAETEVELASNASPARLIPAAQALGIRPGTAFIMMMIDPERPELEDIKQAIREECARFGIRATRADEIEHSNEITQQILDEIRTSEFLIADLTGERPSVYYEIGFAHAIGKRPILYRRAGTKLHFDLAVHNCPEYRNVTDLRERLAKRLTAITRGE
jgi:hypothetical protein